MAASLDRSVVGAVALKPQVDEEPIVSIYLRRPDRLTHYRQDTFALFAGALGDELLHPIAKTGDLR